MSEAISGDVATRRGPASRYAHAGYQLLTQHVAPHVAALMRATSCSFSTYNPDERSDIRNSLRRPLAIAGSTFLDLTRPILRQQAAPHVEMKRGMRPVANASHQAVFHWIVVNIVHVPD